MNNDIWKETMVEQKVTYTLEINGKFIIYVSTFAGPIAQD
jgi:hypothetical protein